MGGLAATLRRMKARPLNEILEAIREDARAGEMRALSVYVEASSGDVEAIAAEFFAAQRRERGSTEGRRIAQYRLIRELGRGGQAVVWLAEDEKLNRRVALKVIDSPGADVHGALDRLRREAEIASGLDHPGICAVYDVGLDDVPFIAMRLVEGDTLADRIHSVRTAVGEGMTSEVFVDLDSGSEITEGAIFRDDDHLSGPDTLREVVAIAHLVEKVARALHAAHEAGVIHRDVKPGNIMVTTRGEPVVLDFGLAREEDGVGPSLTMTGDLMGTPAYMAPEQIAAKRIRLDARCDVYALGVTLFECLTGKRPFERPTREALYNAILTEEAPAIRRLNPSIPRDLAVVVETALAKNREHRYESALAFADDLERVRAIEPIVARRAGPWTKTLRWGQRNPAVATLLALVIVALGATVGVFAWKNREVRQANTLLSKTNLELDASNENLVRKTKEAEENAERAQENAEEAEKNAERAKLEAEAKSAALDRVARLKDRRVLRRLRERADELYPAHPDLVGDLGDWLDEAGKLLARLPLHREGLAALEAKAGPYTDALKAKDHPEAWPRLVAARARLAELENALDEADSEVAEQRLEAEVDGLDEEVVGLEQQVAERRTWGFDDEEAWLYELLRDLVGELEAFGAPDGVGADVRARLALAEEIGPRTLGDQAGAWRAACARILTSEKYGGLELSPQLGLIPLGPDPSTEYEEFLHWQSHARGAPLPERNAEGRFEVAAETGIILVLLPGGTFLMGAQSEDPSKPNHDPEAQPDESPVHEVKLSPFFIGKHEVTRGQYVRMSGRADPSHWIPERSGGRLEAGDLPRLPVERVDWFASDGAARRAGLALPTEACWEFACRAGSDKVFFFGDDPGGLPEHANVRDRQWMAAFKDQTGAGDFDDGHAVVAPVGSFEPNAFGLHDVHGNILEWCADWYAGSAYGRPPVECTDPTGPPGGNERVLRGGSWFDSLRNCRSSGRSNNAPTDEHVDVGFRVSRAPDP